MSGQSAIPLPRSARGHPGRALDARHLHPSHPALLRTTALRWPRRAGLQGERCLRITVLAELATHDSSSNPMVTLYSTMGVSATGPGSVWSAAARGARRRSYRTCHVPTCRGLLIAEGVTTNVTGRGAALAGRLTAQVDAPPSIKTCAPPCGAGTRMGDRQAPPMYWRCIGLMAGPRRRHALRT